MISYQDLLRAAARMQTEMPNTPRLARIEMTEQAQRVLLRQVAERSDVNGWEPTPIGNLAGVPIVTVHDDPPAGSVYGWRAVDRDGVTLAEGTLRPDRWTVEVHDGE